MITPVFFLLLAGICQVCGDGFVLEVQFHSYYNPSHSDYQGNCCSTNCSSSCTNTFLLCLADVSHDCVNSVQAGDINDNFTFILGELFPNGVSNPVALTGPATLNLMNTTVTIVSTTNDTELPTIVDSLKIAVAQLNIYPGGNYTAPTVYNSTDAVFEIELSFQLTCADSYYGMTCSIFCSGEDNSMGHYSCDEDGGKVCNEGYTNPSTNCTEPIQCTVCDDGTCKQSSEDCGSTSDCSGSGCSSVPVVLIAVVGASAVGGVLLILAIIIITSVAVNRRKNAKARVFTTEHKGKKKKGKVSGVEFQSRNGSTIERKLVSEDNVVYDNPLEFIGADGTPTGAPDSGPQSRMQTAIDEPIVHAVTATTNTFQVFTEPNGADNS